mmetsp:Transcript_77484/g.215336  ORF Transcript_77484/g.215336 Transcript_77484/m.215336 type:complete len:250 (+) Transcript_77484:1425-2174(+)
MACRILKQGQVLLPTDRTPGASITWPSCHYQHCRCPCFETLHLCASLFREIPNCTRDRTHVLPKGLLQRVTAARMKTQRASLEVATAMLKLFLRTGAPAMFTSSVATNVVFQQHDVVLLAQVTNRPGSGQQRILSKGFASGSHQARALRAEFSIQGANRIRQRGNVSQKPVVHLCTAIAMQTRGMQRALTPALHDIRPSPFNPTVFAGRVSTVWVTQEGKTMLCTNWTRRTNTIRSRTPTNQLLGNCPL